MNWLLYSEYIVLCHVLYFSVSKEFSGHERGDTDELLSCQHSTSIEKY